MSQIVHHVAVEMVKYTSTCSSMRYEVEIKLYIHSTVTGLFMMPTVFTDVADDNFIAKEESFGPIMVISKFSKRSVVYDVLKNESCVIELYYFQFSIISIHEIMKTAQDNVVKDF